VQRNQLVIDNVRNGFNLHQLDNGACIWTLPTGNPKKLFPQQVAFGEDCKVIVGGSDHGIVYVFDRKTGTPLQVLHHADRGLVQTVTVRYITFSSNNRLIVYRPMNGTALAPS
jgi:hypothetical protein